jgi:hypothetical protein
MTRELTDLKNLQKATAIRKSGFKTGIHASPHKAEIDKWIIENRWSSKVIVNELKRLYPNEEHPSARAIDNYRRKYLALEYIRAAKETTFLPEIKKEIQEKLDVAKEAYDLWSKTKKALDKAMETMEKTNIPPGFLIDLLKVGGQNFQIVTDIYARLGLIQSVPITEVSIIEKKVYEPGELQAKIERIIQLTRRIEEIKRRVSESDEGTSQPGGNREDTGQGSLPEKHSSDVGNNSGVQEPTAH